MRATWFQDDDKPRRPRFTLRLPASVVGILLLINIVVFLLQNILVGLHLDYYLGLNCSSIMSGAFLLYIYQFITYQFLHGGLFHILINMVMLFFFGRELERSLGSRRFLVLYLAGGVLGGVVFLLWSLLPGGSGGIVVGASGAIYGIVVYYAMCWPHRKVNVFLFPIMVPMKVMHLAILFVGISLFSGFFSHAGDPGVAHFCHLGGALFGFLFHRYERASVQLFEESRQRRIRKERQNDEERKTEVDRLLRKIHEEGISSLSSSEKTFLNEASKKLRNRK